MNQIKFSHNWNNKLNNHVFTTIRKWTKEKYDYYNKLQINDTNLLVTLNKRIIKQVKLFSVYTEEYGFIPQVLLQLDTGMIDRCKIDSLFKRFGISSHNKVIILTFETVV